MSRAAIYIRRSSVQEDSPGDVSREAQMDTGRALAEANGIDPESLIVFEDWGKSADETKREKRTGYLSMLEAIERRELDFVFVYHIDRLIRSVKDFSEIQAVADGHTTILTPQFPLTGTDPMARAFAQVAAVFAELELNRIKQRNRKALEVRIARGDSLGHPTWGMRHVRNTDGQLVEQPDPEMAEAVQTVLEAVKRTEGNILQAVRWLNMKGVPSPKGGEWHTSALTRVVKAHAPELVKSRKRTGRPARPAVLAGLIRCHCGQTMTPNTARGQLYCYVGNRQGVKAHGRMAVTEDPVLRWVIGKYRTWERNADQTVQAERIEARIRDLHDQRERLGFAVVDGLMSREQAKERRDAIDGELATLERDQAALHAEPAKEPVVFLYDPDDREFVQRLHRQLRAAVRHVQLDKDMQPISVEWVGS